MTMQLYIGNKNYSSWSMRPWVLMRQQHIEFEERRLRLDFAADSPFKRTLAGLSPASKVPVLVDNGFAVWDTLAIAEYLHERVGGHVVWPAAQRDRARARCLCAEMHGGFAALRTLCPMNVEATLPEVGRRLWADHVELRQDVARIEQMWTELLQAHGGPMLFGGFSAVDAYFAPVVSRMRTYGLPTTPVVSDYMSSVLALAALRQWTAEATQEHEFLPFDEPYRSSSAGPPILPAREGP